MTGARQGMDGNGQMRTNTYVQYGKNGPAYMNFLLFLHLVEVRDVAFDPTQMHEGNWDCKRLPALGLVCPDYAP